MTTQEAYRAGFMLKCASLGIPAEVAQGLLDNPEVVKQGVTGHILGQGYKALVGGAQGVQSLMSKSRQLGESQVKPPSPLGGAPSASGLTDDAIKNLLMAAHYERARRALLNPQS